MPPTSVSSIKATFFLMFIKLVNLNVPQGICIHAFNFSNRMSSNFFKQPTGITVGNSFFPNSFKWTEQTEAPRQKGFSKDGQIGHMVVFGLMIDKDKNPIVYQLYTGSTGLFHQQHVLAFFWLLSPVFVTLKCETCQTLKPSNGVNYG